MQKKKKLTGLKPQLVARLSKALKTEENESIAEQTIETIIEGSDPQTSTTNNNEINEFASNDSMDIDIDMSDIVIIDEYDSTKNESKHDSSSKRVSTIV